MKILVVDDDATTRRIEVRLLKQLGYKDIEEAGDGDVALARLNEKDDVNMVLSDWDMPNMTGLELLKEVRSQDRYKDLPFIMITANDRKESIIEAARAKVSQYIVKPFTAQALEEKINKVLSAGQ